MALWQHVLKSPEHIRERLLGQYGEGFPYEVRHVLADVIEEAIL